jgi:hypothetical protein
MYNVCGTYDDAGHEFEKLIMIDIFFSLIFFLIL